MSSRARGSEPARVGNQPQAHAALGNRPARAALGAEAGNRPRPTGGLPQPLAPRVSHNLGIDPHLQTWQQQAFQAFHIEAAGLAPDGAAVQTQTTAQARDRGSPHDDEQSIADVQIDYMLNGPPGGVRESFSFSSDEEEGLEPNDPGSPHGSERAITDAQVMSFLSDVFNGPEEFGEPVNAATQQQDLRAITEAQLPTGEPNENRALPGAVQPGVEDAGTQAPSESTTALSVAGQKRPAFSVSPDARPSQRQRGMPLPKALKPVAEAYPRLPHEARNNAAYARRLHELSQRDEPLARVGDQPLSLKQLSLLSGTTMRSLRVDPQLQPLSEALKPVAEAYPRLPNEASNNAAYARRLHGLSERDEPLARVGDQPLSLEQLSLLSGATMLQLRRDPQLQPLPAALRPVADAFPRLPAEANTDTAYARRLHALSQADEPLARVGDQSLSIAQLALLSGVTERQLNADPMFMPLPQELKRVAEAFPRLPGEADNALAYASRLHELSLRGDPLARVRDQPLKTAQLALLSGIAEYQLRLTLIHPG